MPHRQMFAPAQRRAGAVLSLTAIWLLMSVVWGCTTKRDGSPPAPPTSAASAGAIRVAMVVAPTTLDPARVPDISTGEMMMHCFEGLLRYNDRNVLEPCLAEKWELSPDKKTYTFHIRSGVKFHNGREMTAADVKYSWERALSPKTTSSVATNYLDGIVGLKAVASGARTDLQGVIVADPHTLKVTIDRPRAYFLSMLTYPSDDVVCREAIEKNNGVLDDKSMVGTGPFALESYQAGSRIVLKAFPDYWGGKATVDRVEFPIILNPETIYDSFETKQVDIWPISIPGTRYSQDKDAGKFTSEYHVLPFAEVDYLVMHPIRQPLFAKPEVRKAFAMAIDREQILKIVYKNNGQVADGVLPPTLPNAGPIPAHIPFDPAQAKQLLANAGFPGGQGFPTLTLTVQDQNPTEMSVGEIIRANLQDNLGISVNIQAMEFGQRLEAANHQSLEMYLANWIADYPDPQDFLSALFISNASLNREGYNNPRFDALCLQADGESDPKKRAALYGEANSLLMDGVGVLPLVFPPRIVLIQQSVRGWKSNLLNLLPLKDARKTVQ